MNRATGQIADAGRRWWLSEGGPAGGPYSEAYVTAGVRSGAIAPGAVACPEGGSVWRPVTEWPPFRASPVKPAAEELHRPATAAAPQPDLQRRRKPTPGRTHSSHNRSDLATPKGKPDTPKPPWDPRAIAWLGLAFTPFWSAAMAALNAYRLSPPRPIWPPLALGAAFLAWELFAPSDDLPPTGFDHGLSFAICAFEAFLIWLVALRPQQQAYDAIAAEVKSPARWRWPLAAGLPLAALTFLAFVVLPLLPYEPRDVCKLLLAAGSPAEAEPYVTGNLRRFVEAEVSVGPLRRGDPELTYEGPFDGEGMYYVCFRRHEAGGPAEEGYFYLLSLDGRWRVEEVYLTGRGGTPLDPPVPLSRNPKTEGWPASAAENDQPATRTDLPPKDESGRRITSTVSADERAADRPSRPPPKTPRAGDWLDDAARLRNSRWGKAVPALLVFLATLGGVLKRARKRRRADDVVAGR